MKKYVGVAIAAELFVLSVPAHAQAQGQAPASQSSSDADIIVTARRSSERLQDVPISITVLDSSAIAKRNIFNAGDLGTYVPSLSTNGAYGPQKSSFAIRGFVQEGRTSPSVGVYFADVVAARANTGTTSGNGAGVGSFMDLQNVQVLKGPQGTLFGRNTTGGAILLVPSKPVDRLEGWVEATVGNFNTRRVQGVLNVPLSDTFRVRAAVDRNKADGYLRNRSETGKSRLADTNYIAARLSIVGDLTPDLEMYTIFSYSRSDTNGIAPKFIACNTAPPGGTLAAALAPLGCAQIARAKARKDSFWDIDDANPNAMERQEQWQVINTNTWQASDFLTVKNIVSYAEFREDANFSLWGDNLLVPGAGGFRLPVLTIEDGVTGRYASQYTFTEELQLQGRTASGSLNWQAGAYYEHSKPLAYNSAYNNTFIDCANAPTFQCTNPLGFGTISSANIKNTFTNIGFYAQGTYKLTDQLGLTGGLRYTVDRVKDQSRNVTISIPTPGSPVFTCQNVALFNEGSITQPLQADGPNSAICNSVIKIKSEKPTWLINLDYKPSADMLLYLKWTRGYRQGGIISGNIGIESWKPETVDTYEAGAKLSFRGAVPGYFNVAAFYNDFRNQQLAVNTLIAPAFVGAIPPIQAIVNAGKSRIWGVEVETSVRPFTGMKIDVGYAYLNTKLVKYTSPEIPQFYSLLAPVAEVGGPLSNSPKNRVTVTGAYTLPLDNSIGEISLGATYTHTDAAQILPVMFSPYLYKTRASNLLNLNADWRAVLGSPFDFSFFMTNATNQKRVTYPTGSYQTIGVDTGQLNLPRMFGFRLKYRFGS